MGTLFFIDRFGAEIPSAHGVAFVMLCTVTPDLFNKYMYNWLFFSDILSLPSHFVILQIPKNVSLQSEML